MLACYCLQGKQLTSGVIGLLTCQSHYNVSGIHSTPCARLLLRHPLAQRIPTEACECSVTLPGAWSNTPVANWTSSLPCAWPNTPVANEASFLPCAWSHTCV